jgi:chromosome segregation ATPase
MVSSAEQRAQQAEADLAQARKERDEAKEKHDAIKAKTRAVLDEHDRNVADLQETITACRKGIKDWSRKCVTAEARATALEAALQKIADPWLATSELRGIALAALPKEVK